MKFMNLVVIFLFASVTVATATQAQETDKKPDDTFSFGEYNTLIQASKWNEAGAMLDAGLKDSPDSPKLLLLSLQLANRSMQAEPEAAEKRLIALIEHYNTSPSISASAARDFTMANDFLSMMLMRQDRSQDALNIMTTSMNTLVAGGDNLLPARRDLEPKIARLLLQLKRQDEALTLMRASMEDIKARIEKGTSDLRDLVRATNMFSNLFDEIASAESAEHLQFAEKLVTQKLNTEPIAFADLSAYASLRSAQLSELTYSDPERGIEMANELIARIEAFSIPSDEAEAKQLEALGKSIKRMMSSLESSMVRVRLIGTAAPEYEAQSFVGMEPTTLAQLRGKVVLLDFWAVWCGPCIATFPHLREWNEAYGDKGFAILGMTSDQGYVWDAEKGRAVRGENVSHEQELEMLTSFREHHKLTHGFVLTPKESSYNKQLAVAGIPQAVLLDQQGVIRMIKVGSGPKNAKDLEDEIKKLLNNLDNESH